MFLSRFILSPLSGHSFHPPPTTSRPPTKVYDRQSYVLVSSRSDDVLKFMKMHLNRYFSHVVASKSATEALNLLREKEFDLLIAEAQPTGKPPSDFLRRVGSQFRSLPVVLIDHENAGRDPNEYPSSLVIGFIVPPFELDSTHIAIRRSLNVRLLLKELNGLLPPRMGAGEIVRADTLPKLQPRATELIELIRTRLTEEIID